MAQSTESIPFEPLRQQPLDDEQKLAILRQALIDGAVSPEAEGDIFAQVAAEYGLSLDDDDQ